MNKKTKIVLIALALIVVVGSITVAALSVYKPGVLTGVFNKSYSVVYLDSGEIYVGKLSTFPRLRLDESYVLQVVTDKDDPSKNGFQLAPLSETLWSPKAVYLNKDHIVFTAPVRDDSKVTETLKSKGK